jgi:hypothetical protein
MHGDQNQALHQIQDPLARIMKNHSRVKINEAGHDFGACRHHRERKNEFYCNQC